MLPAPDPAAAPLLADLLPRLKLGLTQARAYRGHLLGHFGPPDALTPEESWHVDLTEPSFHIYDNHKPRTDFDVQLVGTWSGRDGSFVWGHHNPSIASVGTERLAAWLDQQPDLAPLARIPRFHLSREDADDLTCWITMLFGWIGPYPGATGDVVAMLAVKPLPPRGSAHPLLWCTFCGKTQRQVQKLMAGKLCNLCDGDDCLGLFAEVRETIETPKSERTVIPPGLGCCLCYGESRPVIQHRYTGVCVDCIDLVNEILTG
ncbi:DUF6882 domain-containing protein [Chondromyces apiculatus]|uniref:Uncharacterized protein n=1 Tax=Chondromyces apiculatus DSM 436 TaxID=1192034 RepID=A0A017TEN5_9BACT|nr:DUF6882 domain-containing protein [Chondromyces apiculatus]EYF07031.1 Hypothetical protein CAP_1290 [Chondromyces apiculatus DSM 436]